jgi:hypothetical protein
LRTDDRARAADRQWKTPRTEPPEARFCEPGLARLEPEGEGTRLSLEHAGFDLDSPLGKTAFEGMGRGWPGVIARIDAALTGA